MSIAEAILDLIRTMQTIDRHPDYSDDPEEARKLENAAVEALNEAVENEIQARVSMALGSASV